MSKLTYQEACDIYLQSAGNLPLPSEGRSEEIDGGWYLENVNGFLAVVTPDGNVLRSQDLLPDGMQDLDIAEVIRSMGVTNE